MVTAATKTVYFSCACEQYERSGECEHARTHIAVLGEMAPHLQVLLRPYDYAGEHNRKRMLDNDPHWSCRHHLARRGTAITAEIAADPDEAAALDRAMEQARRGELITQGELDAALEDEEEPEA